MRVDFYNMTVIRIHGKPYEWEWCKLDSHNKPPGYFEIRGGVPVGKITRGKNKGRNKWPKNLDVIWLKFTDIDETRKLWEQETGNCSKCYGEGKTIESSSVVTGKTYKPCVACEGSGKAREVVEQ